MESAIVPFVDSAPKLTNNKGMKITTKKSLTEVVDLGRDGGMLRPIERWRRALRPLVSGLHEAPEQLKKRRAAEARRPRELGRVLLLDRVQEIGEMLGPTPKISEDLELFRAGLDDARELGVDGALVQGDLGLLHRLYDDLVTAGADQDIVLVLVAHSSARDQPTQLLVVVYVELGHCGGGTKNHKIRIILD